MDKKIRDGQRRSFRFLQIYSDGCFCCCDCIFQGAGERKGNIGSSVGVREQLAVVYGSLGYPCF